MNGDISRVLKAPTQPVLDFTSLQFPLYASDKEDGIRLITHPRLGPVSQTLKPIPNHHVRSLLSQVPLCLDGELVAVSSEGNDLGFNNTQSAIMTQQGQPLFQFRVFDWFECPHYPYDARRVRAKALVENHQSLVLTYLTQTQCECAEDVEACEDYALSRGKEGLMLRSPFGFYKEGRSTLNEAFLLKVKRFQDDEAVVVGIEQEMENCNPATLDTGGLQRRSKHQANMRGKGCVGKLICQWQSSTGMRTIKIGSGLTAKQKEFWWFNPQAIIGKTITFKFQKHGMLHLPRAPIFKGVRHDV